MGSATPHRVLEFESFVFDRCMEKIPPGLLFAIANPKVVCLSRGGNDRSCFNQSMVGEEILIG